MKRANGQPGPRGLMLAKSCGEDPVIYWPVFRPHDVGRELHHVLRAATGGREDRQEVVDRLLGLHLKWRPAIRFSSGRDRQLPRHVDEAAGPYRLSVMAKWSWRLGGGHCLDGFQKVIPH